VPSDRRACSGSPSPRGSGRWCSVTTFGSTSKTCQPSPRASNVCTYRPHPVARPRFAVVRLTADRFARRRDRPVRSDRSAEHALRSPRSPAPRGSRAGTARASPPASGPRARSERPRRLATAARAARSSSSARPPALDAGDSRGVACRAAGTCARRRDVRLATSSRPGRVARSEDPDPAAAGDGVDGRCDVNLPRQGLGSTRLIPSPASAGLGIHERWINFLLRQGPGSSVDGSCVCYGSKMMTRLFR